MSVAEISELIGLITACLGLVGMIVAYIKKVYSNIKEKNLKAFIEEQIVIAENTETNGKEKLCYVLNALERRYGLKEFLKIEQQAKDYIEECIDFSKKVNSK